MSLFDLSGRAALVTGSTRGIGRGIADALREAGADVIYHSLQTRPDDLPRGAICLHADTSQREAPRALMEQAFSHYPHLDILVSNAGSYYDKPFLEMDDERWYQTMDTNVRASYFLIQNFARRLIAEKRGGSAIIIGSANGFQAEYDSTCYDTARGACVMMTRSLAITLAAHNIRVNSVAPGLVRTPFTEKWLDANDAIREHFEKTIPMRRIGAIDDCRGAAVFLASDAASYVTGHILVIDGGLTAQQISRP